MVIKLLSSNMTVLDTTLTTNDLNEGDYYIQFIKPSGKYYTLQTQDTQNKSWFIY